MTRTPYRLPSGSGVQYARLEAEKLEKLHAAIVIAVHEGSLGLVAAAVEDLGLVWALHRHAEAIEDLVANENDRRALGGGILHVLLPSPGNPGHRFGMCTSCCGFVSCFQEQMSIPHICPFVKVHTVQSKIRSVPRWYFYMTLLHLVAAHYA